MVVLLGARCGGSRRRRRATSRLKRRAELNAYMALDRERSLLIACGYIMAVTYSAACCWVAYSYGVKFTRGLMTLWAITCLTSVVLEGVVVEPLVILGRALVYDVRRMFFMCVGGELLRRTRALAMWQAPPVTLTHCCLR